MPDVKRECLDLGLSHLLWFTSWDPDLDLNPQYAGLDLQLPAIVGAIMSHRKQDGAWCDGSIHFDFPIARKYFGDHSFWTVDCWDPLSLSPSLLCHCGDHGYIKEGIWVPA